MENRYISLQQSFKPAARYVDGLDEQGQIDRDSNGEPFVVGTKDIPDQSTLIRVFIKRNNKTENFIIKKRSRTGEPERKSFDIEDGWQRDDSKPVSDKKPVPKKNDSNRERERRAFDVDDPESSKQYEGIIRELMKRNIK